ncbi:hypothetical protein KRP22_004063 [Phytophthora ramorum]|nr:hypothetical protein KRP22_9996 [Phytophthora ramorum]
MSSVFLRAWDNLKSRPSALSLPRQSTYFCGSRLHHWKFVVGKVEIGSGSHEEKREAFRLATTSAADFLLQLDDGQNDRRWRPYRRDSFSSESSDECEFLYARNVNSESVAADAAITVSDDSPDSATDVSTAGSAAIPQDENVVTARDPTSQIDDSDTEELHMAIEPAAPILNNATTTNKSCNMCEVIRMRKPDSAGCRQCQLAEEANRNSSEETKVAAKKAPRADSTATAQPLEVPEPSAQPPPKRPKRIFDMLRTLK